MNAIKLILTIAILTSVNLNCLGQEETSNEKLIQEMSKSAIWTPELDAVIASPKNHKVILENDKVRVLEITLLPNETENLHHHKWPSVIYIPEGNDFVDYDGEGNILIDSRKLTNPSVYPIVIYNDNDILHQTKNVSKTKSIRLIRVEMKQ